MLYCITDIVGTPTPGAYISKGGIDVEMGGGGVPLFYYITVQSHLLCVTDR